MQLCLRDRGTLTPDEAIDREVQPTRTWRAALCSSAKHQHGCLLSSLLSHARPAASSRWWPPPNHSRRIQVSRVRLVTTSQTPDPLCSVMMRQTDDIAGIKGWRAAYEVM
ncbi:uncharacterized protein TrAtP1_007808 [Trichoderma atroviride]|uniref:uncharacterized protein n=1 Tax=Hypocrea atroviridis TaxID=63577 RepID=UPI0033185256|nr:hypothetical protein TrAtP1_007808 [Trichoderma atroviride]